MEKMEEMVKRLKNRIEDNLSEDEIIKLCFSIIKNHNSVIEQSRGAVILSGISKKGLGARTKKFLEDNPNLPNRVQEVLYSAILRMECY